MRTSTWLAGILLLASMGGISMAHEEDPVEIALRAPPATGLLVTNSVPGTQAHTAGIAVGDIVLSYDGVAAKSIAELSAAKEAAAEKEKIACSVRKASGETVEVTLAPGPLGLNLTPVTKGEPAGVLPPDTGAVLDPSSIGDRDEWFAFEMGGGHIGYEHVVVKVAGDVLHVTHEVAFDGGDQWGLNHMLVRATIRCGTTVEPLTLDFNYPRTDWKASGRLARDAEGHAVWRGTRDAMGEADGEAQPFENRLRPGASSVPTYLVTEIARLMPQEKDACFRFRPIGDTDGSGMLPAALVCTGSEELDLGEKKVATWKYEQRQLGGSTTASYWVDGERNIVRANYNGPVATLATKEKALEGVTPELASKTADE
jgi:hypothetical protein